MNNNKNDLYGKVVLSHMLCSFTEFLFQLKPNNLACMTVSICNIIRVFINKTKGDNQL